MTEARVQICRGTMADLEAILVLERATATAPHWSQATYAEILSASEQEDRGNQPRRCLFVAHGQDRVAGFAVAATPGTETAEIESVVVEESFLGRMLGYGTVILRGTGGTPEVFPQIAHPLQFREQVQRQIAGESKPV